jgi:hypothetical protein
LRWVGRKTASWDVGHSLEAGRSFVVSRKMLGMFSSSSSEEETAELQTRGSEILVPITKSTSQIGTQIKKKKKKERERWDSSSNPPTHCCSFSFTTLVELLGYTRFCTNFLLGFSPQLLLGTHLL